MTQYTPRSVERTALPDAVDALGVDGDGRTHYITPRSAGPVTIYVETGDGFDVFELEETPCDGLEGWVDHVGTLRGWNRLCYAESFGDHLADSLEVGA
ncbi:hypothetical protein [Halorientalis regularis]|nr:hypothetical protein [Halorientalis regularis]